MIYLDNAATTACAPKVVEAMLPYFTDLFANASSVDHSAGAQARKAVEEARASVAQLLNAKPEDVIFTSGSTEANNLLFSIDTATFTTQIEHPSILQPFELKRHLSDQFISVDSAGLISLEHLEKLLQNQKTTTLVTIIGTNNEIGTEQQLTDISDLCKRYSAILHIDATQMIGTQQIDVTKLSVSALSLSAHKIHGPKGVGALIANSKVRRLLKPLTRGGGQERSFRSGTLNVPGIVGFGTAAKILIGNATLYRNRITKLRNSFLDTLKSETDGMIFETVPSAVTSPHILSLRFAGVNGRALLGAVSNEACFSLGSACATNKSEPSHVLLALGVAKADIARTVRFSFSREDDETAILSAAHIIASAASRLSSLSVA